MIHTLAKMREFTRNLDPRLEDLVTYPDTWIDSRIEEGLALAQDIKSIFYTQEKYDLTTNIDVDLLTEMEIIPQREVHSIYAVECDQNYYDVRVTANNHVIISLVPDAPIPLDRTVLIRYFFYPTLPFTELEMSMEMYRFVKASIASNTFSWLSDEDNEQYHMAKAESMIIKSTFDIEKDLLDVPVDRLWRGSWA